ncbi:urease accessory protein UreF [Halococcus sp. IIIV-5B]|uniref:urease accessory protein UreF n=1 Tax=Halococcus sp. IIIV-5B TaxID=2321230 RepID=UPI000E7512AF|nr:urease accessory UreF family protein [Halococcus sp. IIIV-5B]RJT07459.1 urease accessory protein UreF [Halococcus sp. IIIV-5B]
MKDKATLEALRLSDSFLPIGTFTVSYGLEQFVASGRVDSGEDLEALLVTYLKQLVGPGDLVALQTAHQAAKKDDLEGICEADRRLHAITLPAEMRESATRAGERLLRLQQDINDAKLLKTYAAEIPDNAPGTYPAALGVVTAGEGVPPRRACLVHCHTFVTGLLGAAQRLLSLGHTEIQRVLTALQPVMKEIISENTGRSLDDMTSYAPLIDIVSAKHERAERRLFVS